MKFMSDMTIGSREQKINNAKTCLAKYRNDVSQVLRETRIEMRQLSYFLLLHFL